MKVWLVPGAKVNPASASVCIACCLLDAVKATMLPFGTITKNSEVFDSAPMAMFGSHPPLGVDVEVKATRWRSTVAFPVFLMVKLRELCERAAPVISKRVMS